MLGYQEGIVEEFDDAVGLGVITRSDPSAAPGTALQKFAFHCTQIADGSRTTTAGTAVVFAVGAGHRGTWEAYEVRTAKWVCPVCGSVNDGDPRSYELCARCGWEDDPVQFDDPTYAGGANAASMNRARDDWSERLSGSVTRPV